MAVRQYIGARYVPRFFENPNNTAEWLPNVIYEPLTIVTYGLNSYTSKKTVPASVGDPANNPDYWVATGNMNAFINELQDQIDDMKDGEVSGSLQNQIDTMKNGEVSGSLQNQIDTMNDGDVTGSLQNQVNALTTNKEDKRNLLVIGNSYVNYGCADKLKSFFAHSYVFTEGGGGFVEYAGHTKTYEDCLDDAIADTTFDNSTITDIIFVSAMGDSRAVNTDRATYETALKTTLQSIKTKIANNFPNCKRSVITLAETRDVAAFSDSLLSSLFAIHHIFKHICTNYGFEYIGWSGFNTLFKAEYIQSDHYHPSTAGAVAIGTWIVNAYFGNAEYENYESRGSCEMRFVNTTDVISVVAIVSPDSVNLNVRTGAISSGTLNIAANGVMINTTQLPKPVPAPMYALNLIGHLYAYSSGTESLALTPIVGSTTGEGQLVIRNRLALSGSFSGGIDVSIDVLNNIEYKLD